MEMTFEVAIERLEEIVRALDGGESTLDESLALYEEGVKLARFCSARLTDARGKLELLADGGTKPLEF
ncbi:MAG: exodeoxyribonuclease VII small subunit [Armatimonadota bacterium]